MAKERRASVTIDESVIQGMIDGGMPHPEEVRKEIHSGGTIPAPADTPTVNAASDTAKPRKRREQKDYGGVFLTKRPPTTKKQTYIGAALFNKITAIMAVVANDITLPTFLDNVLEHHQETYRDEINKGITIVGHYYLHFWNRLRAIDENNYEGGEPNRFGLIHDLERFSLNAALLDGILLEHRSVFVLEEKRTMLIVHQSVRDAMEAKGLAGMRFFRVDEWDEDAMFR